MANLNDFIDPDLTAADVVHSSGYASAAAGAAIGAGGGGLSMQKRHEMLNKARTVGAYGMSELGRRYSASKARTADQLKGRVYDASTGTFSNKAGYSQRRGGYGTQRQATPAVQQRTFVEPPKRNYNPYG